MGTPYIHEYLQAIDHPLRLLGETFRVEFDFLLSQITKNSLVLDVGCGVARPAKDIAPFAKQVVCLDNDKEMLQLAMQRGSGVSNMTYVFGEAERLHFPDNEFDFAFATYNLIGSIPVSEREAMVREMARVIKPGGKIFVVTWKNDSGTTEFLKRYYPSIGITIIDMNDSYTRTNKGLFDRLSLEDLKNYFEKAGISNPDLVDIGPVWMGLLGAKKK